MCTRVLSLLAYTEKSIMAAEQLPGGHLLAALHSQMERMKTVVRVSKAASKKPHSRSNTDINDIYAETQSVAFFAKDGPAVHRDLCHVLQALSLSQMQSFRLPGEYKSGIMAYVMQGRLQLRTRSKAAFEHGLDTLSNSSNSGSSSGSCATSIDAPPASNDGSSLTSGNTSASGSPSASAASSRSAAGNSPSSTSDSNVAGMLAGGSDGSKHQGKPGTAGAPSEADLKALFDSIDKDGSGAIDVEELQYALSVMGIEKSPAEVQELMDSVDKDGSGELEFEEFVIILTTKLGLGGAVTESAWQELPDGTWCLEVQQGGCFGEAALLHGLVQQGMVLALDDCSLLILEATSYHPILTQGFDGQLNEKVAILKRCTALASCISSRSDLRGLAYAAVSERYGWGGHLYAAGQPAAAMYIIQEGCCRIIAKHKAESSNPVAITAAQPPAQTAAAARISAAAPASSNRSGSGLPTGDTSPAAVAAGRHASAAAALLSSPRYGLHSPRSRMVEKRTELAVLGPGDIAGEASLLGLQCHQSTAVVSSASLLVLTLQKQDLQQLLHPADMQQLLELLQLREHERQQRLTTASATNTAVQLQQLQVKAAAGTAEPAQELPSAWDTVVEPLTSTGAVSHRALGRSSICGASRSAAGMHSSGGASSSRAAACKSPRSVEKQHERLQLPSAAASVAAAIATAGGSPRRDLPSRLERERANSMHQLLEDMSTSTQEMEDAQSTAVLYAAAALAAAQAEAAAAAAGSAGGSCSSCNALGYGVYANGSTAGIGLSVAAGEGRNTAHSCIRLDTNGAGGSRGCSGGSSSSSPHTARQNGSTCQHVTAAELLLPPGLQRKIEAALRKASGDGMPSSSGSSCSRSYRHTKTDKWPVTSTQGINITVGTVSSDRSIRSRSQRECGGLHGSTNSSRGSASCCGACRKSSNSSPVGGYLRSQTAMYVSCPGHGSGGQRQLLHSRSAGQATATQSSSNSGSNCSHGHTCGGLAARSSTTANETAGPQQHCGGSLPQCDVLQCAQDSGSAGHRASSACCTTCTSSAAGTAATSSYDIRDVGQVQLQQQAASSSHTTDGSGAIMKHQVERRCSICGSQSGLRLGSATIQLAASARCGQPQGDNSTPGRNCPTAAAIAAAVAGLTCTGSPTGRSSKPLSAAPQMSKPTSPRSSGALLQPLGTCTAPDAAIGNQLIQGFTAPVISNRKSGVAQAGPCPGRNSNASCMGMCAEATFALHTSAQPPGCQRVQMCTQVAAHGPSTDGFSLTDRGQTCWPAPRLVTSEEAATAISAAVAAAETMRATNSIDLGPSTVSSPRTRRTPRASKLSAAAVATQQAANGNAAVSVAGAAAAAAAAASARRRSSTAAAMLQSVSESMLTQAAGRQSGTSLLQTTRSSAGGAATIPGTCMRCDVSSSCTSNTAREQFLKAKTAAQGVQQRTPRSSRSPRVGAQPVPARLFSAVDRPVWQAAEAAAGCTSWSLGVRLLQSPRPGSDVQHWPTPGSDVGCQPKLVHHSAGTAAQSADQQGQQQQQASQPRHGSLPCVPRLPLHKLQDMMLSTDTQGAGAACSSVHDCNTHCCDGTAVLQVNAASNVSVKADCVTATTGSAYQTAQQCWNVAAAPDAIETRALPENSGSIRDRPSGSQPARTAVDAQAVMPSRQMVMPGSLHQAQQPHQQQRHHQVQKLGSTPVQQLNLPLDSAACAASGAALTPVAPLPEWRSTLTTRWRQGGRFSQQGGFQTDNLYVGGSQISRF